jgi:SAM-dependent methyltransferase
MSQQLPEEIVTGNVYDKFNTQNPVAKRLMQGFKGAFKSLYLHAQPEAVLEVGCGEGYMLEYMQQLRPVPFVGMDIGMDVLQQAVKRSPQAQISLADAHRLPYATDDFDLVVCCEVLEHVATPEVVVKELRRVTSKYIIASVPREPIWRMLNMARGAFWKDLGNTPGHVNHWSSRGFTQLLAQEFNVLQVDQPLPWTMILAEVK